MIFLVFSPHRPNTPIGDLVSHGYRFHLSLSLSFYSSILVLGDRTNVCGHLYTKRWYPSFLFFYRPNTPIGDLVSHGYGFRVHIDINIHIY